MKVNLLAVMLILSVNLFPQNQNSIGKIDYKMIVNSNNNFAEFNATLLFNNHISKFIFSNKIRKNELVENKDVMGMTVIKITKNDTVTNSIINDLAKKTIYNITDKEVIFENNESQSWILTDEEKFVGNLKCKSATCTFRGRDYTAWFTEDIPLPFGPWKFGGLPGLIIEISDKTSEVYFISTKVEIPYITPIINKIENKKIISRDEFLKNNEKKYKKRAEEIEEKGRIIESLAGKNEKIIIKISTPLISKGIELD